MAKPISPNEAQDLRRRAFPEEVIEAFNELIAENLVGTRSVVMQKEAVQLIKIKMNLDDSDVIFRKHWLDVEDVYEKAGWKVEYDKPAYCETYDAYFTFTKPRES